MLARERGLVMMPMPGTAPLSHKPRGRANGRATMGMGLKVCRKILPSALGST